MRKNRALWRIYLLFLSFFLLNMKHNSGFDWFLQASSLPMSIIIVGVGNAEFDGKLQLFKEFNKFLIMSCLILIIRIHLWEKE